MQIDNITIEMLNSLPEVVSVTVEHIESVPPLNVKVDKVN